jgi:alkanesulfonate monooxygenase SsuD/methylene tetrahydromethanopterin reductase-like flavin-dependent oxidoreductase (luciferase family)
MKSIFFHMQGYRDLPNDFEKKYESVWVTLPNDELCDPQMVNKYLHWNISELELADELGFDGVGVNEHHQNAYGFPVGPNMIASILARRQSDAAVVVLGNTIPLHNPPLRVAEEYALLDCLSGGRLVAGLPVGSPPDTVGNYGLPPTHVRERYYEAYRLLIEAWTRSGPFPFNGRFTKLRYVNPWPKPIQKPHPPIWLAGGGSVETWKFATDNNYTYSYLTFSGMKQAKSMMQGYWDQVERAGLDDNPYRGGVAQIVVVAADDAEAERLYLPHLRNFYSKSLHIPPYIASPPGFLTKKSVEFAMMQNIDRAQARKLVGDVSKATWKDFTETYGMVVGGGPDTVAEKLEEGIRDLRIGHLLVVLQVQSMDHDLTKYNTRLFAEKVLPRVRRIWEKEGYRDHWWPQGATRHSRAPLGASASSSQEKVLAK